MVGADANIEGINCVGVVDGSRLAATDKTKK
jgi:hypothetical protein